MKFSSTRRPSRDLTLISNARLADVLAEDGHDVTLLQLDFGPDYEQKFSKSARLWAETFEWPARYTAFRPAAFAKKIFSEGSLISDYWQMIGWQDRFMDACEHIIASNELVKKVKDEKFDVYIGEQLDLCGSGLSHALGIPIHVMMHSCPLMQHLGAYRTTRVFRKHYGADFPHVGKIVGDSPLIFVNVEEFVDMPRPTYQNFVYIGGLGLHDTKNLSLGDAHSKEDLRITGPFQKMREATKNLSNVFLTSWAPQPAILNHPRLQLFCTHGGYNSIVESARFGVPLALVGFFGDQPLNAMTVERNGWGLSIPKGALLRPSDEFETKVKRILADPSFKTAAKRTQRLITTKPMSAEQRVVAYMRFLEQNGGRLPELQSEGRNLSFVEFYNLDLLLLAAASSLACLPLSRKPKVKTS
ncbi:Glucuronosyltransferase [Aphelenchoides fujianensis]|nr:Glucuronosyltransferase [Aphelenchoides fujianensis]